MSWTRACVGGQMRDFWGGGGWGVLKLSHVSARDTQIIKLGAFQAVGDCHKRGVVHADIKPDNIRSSSDKSRTTLVDFGTASIRAGVR